MENMFKVIVNKILGYKIDSISEIRLSPKQEEDRALSDLLNSLLQVFIQQENYDKSMIERDKNLLIGGLGVIQLWVSQDKDKNVITPPILNDTTKTHNSPIHSHANRKACSLQKH